MTYHEFTDEEIVKALEYVADCVCCKIYDCPVNGAENVTIVANLALSLINRQKVEIDSLRIANEERSESILSLNLELLRLQEKAKKSGAIEVLREIHGRSLRHFERGGISSLEIDTTTWNAIVKKYGDMEESK